MQIKQAKRAREKCRKLPCHSATTLGLQLRRQQPLKRYVQASLNELPGTDIYVEATDDPERDHVTHFVHVGGSIITMSDVEQDTKSKNQMIERHLIDNLVDMLSLGHWPATTEIRKTTQRIMM